MKMPKPVLFITLVIFLAQIACAKPDFSVAERKTSFTLPFDFVDNRVFIQVRINGQGPFSFILDTGGVAAIDENVAQKLELKIRNSGDGQGVGENTVRSGETNIARVQIGDLELHNIEFSVLPLDDSPNVFGTKKVDGIIGLPVFESMVVKHDYLNHQLTFTVSGKFNYSRNGEVVSFKRPVQIPVVEASLDGVPGEFGVDTGARSALLLYGPFVEANHLREKYKAKLEGVTGWGIGGPVRSQLARAHEFKIGGVGVSEIVIRLSTQKTGLTTSANKAGLIGPDVLSQFDVTFDYSRHRIIFEKNANYGRADSYDRAGVWMGQDGAHFKVVDVIAGGPADAAGVQQGETILAINGRDTSTLLLPDVREKIRRTAPGEKLILLLSSGGKQRTVTITLRDLV